MKLAHALVSLTCGLGALVASMSTAAAAPAGTVSIAPGWCRDTTNPGTILENDTAKLTWDAFGNLTLVNHMGRGSESTWGIQSATALTGASTAKVCFDSATGRLRIVDGSGAEVWSSGSYTASSGTSLVLNKCSLRVKQGGTQLWEEHTPDCDRRSYPTPASQAMCWPTATYAQKVVWNNDEETELVWTENAQLELRYSGDVVWTSPNPANWAAKVCYQPDGNLIIFDGSGGVMWASNTAFTGQTMMAIDACGIGFSGTSNPRDQTKRVNATTCNVGSIRKGWCRKKTAPGTLVSSYGTRLDWTGSGALKLYDKSGLIWTSNPTFLVSGEELCFQDDGNLVVYTSSHMPLWASGVSSLFTANTLTIEGCQLQMLAGAQHASCVEAQQLLQSDDASLTQAQRAAAATRVVGCATCGNFTNVVVSPSACVQGLPGGGFSFVKDLKAGNADFGAELWMAAAATNSAGLSALRTAVSGNPRIAADVNADLPTGTPPSTYFEALATAGISATLFGHQETLLDANGYIENLNGPADSVLITSMGTTLYSSTTTGIANPAVETTLFEAEQQYVLLGIPLIVKADLTGEIGANVNLSYDGTTFTATETPYGKLDVSCSVGVGVDGLSAGVQGELNLVTISVPFSQSLGFGDRSYSSDVGLGVSTLSGEVDLYAEAGPLKATKQIASFDGYSTQTKLVSVSGSL